MKTLVISSLILMSVSCLSFAELTKSDLQEIQKMFDKQKQDIKEYVQTEIRATKAEIRATKAELMQEIIKVDAKLDVVKGEVQSVRTEVQSVRTEVQSVKDGQTGLKWFIGTLVAFIVAAILLPTLILTWLQRKKERESEQMQQQLNKIRQELDLLKKSPITIGR